jgi:hypothetical protein
VFSLQTKQIIIYANLAVKVKVNFKAKVAPIQAIKTNTRN